MFGLVVTFWTCFGPFGFFAPLRAFLVLVVPVWDSLSLFVHSCVFAIIHTGLYTCGAGGGRI